MRERGRRREKKEGPRKSRRGKEEREGKWRRECGKRGAIVLAVTGLSMGNGLFYTAPIRRQFT